MAAACFWAFLRRARCGAVTGDFSWGGVLPQAAHCRAKGRCNCLAVQRCRAVLPASASRAESICRTREGIPRAGFQQPVKFHRHYWRWAFSVLDFGREAPACEARGMTEFL